MVRGIADPIKYTALATSSEDACRAPKNGGRQPVRVPCRLGRTVAGIPAWTISIPRSATSLGLQKDFVVHSLRHTMLTRLGESGADAFTIMRIAGHSSVTVSQRYVHPSSESLETAFARMDALNRSKRQGTPVIPIAAVRAKTVSGAK